MIVNTLYRWEWLNEYKNVKKHIAQGMANNQKLLFSFFKNILNKDDQEVAAKIKNWIAMGPNPFISNNILDGVLIRWLKTEKEKE